MAKRRFNLDDNFNDIDSYINTPKETPITATPVQTLDEPKKGTTVTDKSEENISNSEPNKLFRRNITLSKEMFWRLNYIKDRKNKNRGDGDKFVTIDGLMFEMIQQCLDTQYASTKKKFDEYNNEEAEDWI